MTLFLASVVTAHEAKIAGAGGADIVDFAGPARSGTFDARRLEAVRAEVGGRCRTSVTLADPTLDASALLALATAAAAAGIDMLRVALGPSEQADARLAALAPLADRLRLVGVLHADRDYAAHRLDAIAAHRFAGVMLETAAPERLLSHLDLTALQQFAQRCAAAKLDVGFAGALEAPDVERLLLLHPDMLGFRAALTRNGAFSPARVEMIRALIPRMDAGPEMQSAARRAGARSAAGPEPADRVFVHDLILPVSIGAYDREREGVQEVRFNVDADVRRAAQGAHDMRDVFSYDLIMDAIRLILDGGHVVFVETLAEAIAQAVLSHPRVLKIRVRVEKLGLGAGGVGVEICRDRASAAATVHRLFAEPAVGGGPA